MSVSGCAGGQSRASPGARRPGGNGVASECLPFLAAQKHSLGADFCWFHEKVLWGGNCRGACVQGFRGAAVREGLFLSASLCFALSCSQHSIGGPETRPQEVLTCKINIRNPASGHPRKASDSRWKANRVKEHFFSSNIFYNKSNF